MKQHITVEQLQLLRSDDKVCTLNTLMKHEWNLTYEQFKHYTWYKCLEDTAKYCTITKMIETLQREGWIVRIGCYLSGNQVEIAKGITKESEKYVFYDIGLCDALWEATQVLLK